eukprot:14604943-Ditylum_brightwellii.AAC.1
MELHLKGELIGTRKGAFVQVMVESGLRRMDLRSTGFTWMHKLLHWLKLGTWALPMNLCE